MARLDGLTETRREILRTLIASGPMARVELVRSTGFSKATVSRIVKQLIDDECLLREADRTPARKLGRPATLLEFATDIGFVCGIDLGGTNTRFLLGDLSGRVRAERQIPTPTRKPQRLLADWLAEETFDLLRTNGSARPRPRFYGATVGVPGVVDPELNTIRFAPNLPQVEGSGLVERLRDRLAATVAFDNGANLALLGETHFGASRGATAAVMLMIGTGLGAGVALDGALLRGRSGFVGEFGCLQLEGGEVIEEVLGGPGLLRQAQMAGVSASSAAEIFSGSAPARLRGVRAKVVESLVRLLVALTAAYDPEIIVIGGGVGGALGPILPALSQRLAELVLIHPRLAISELGAAAGPVGAFVAALQGAWLELDVPLTDLHRIDLDSCLPAGALPFAAAPPKADATGLTSPGIRPGDGARDPALAGERG